jgi:hypothetical protein
LLYEVAEHTSERTLTDSDYTSILQDPLARILTSVPPAGFSSNLLCRARKYSVPSKDRYGLLSRMKVLNSPATTAVPNLQACNCGTESSFMYGAAFPNRWAQLLASCKDAIGLLSREVNR